MRIWEEEGVEGYINRDADFPEKIAAADMGINLEGEGKVYELYANPDNVLDVDNQKFSGGVDTEGFTREDFASDAEWEEFRMEQPYGIRDADGNFYDLYDAINRSSWKYMDVDAGEVIARLEDEFGFIGDWYDVSFSEIADELRKLEIIDDDTGAWASGQFIQDVMREMGFNGVKMSAQEAFTGKGMGGTLGMSDIYGTTHYIVFEPENVKSIHNRGTWDPAERNIYYQKSNGDFDQVKSDGETAETFGMKAGTYDEAARPFPPTREMMEQGWDEKAYPFLRALEDKLTGGGAKIAKSLDEIDLDPGVGKELRRYVEKVKGQQTDVKYAGIQHAKMRRDAALLNYQKRLGIDNVTEALIPYQFYYTRAGLRWMANFANRPALLAHYARIRSDEKKLESKAQPGYPSRLLGKVPIPLPFLPDWAQGKLYGDPLNSVMQVEQFFDPWNVKVEENERIDRHTLYVIEGYYNDGSITKEEARQSYINREGEIWDRAREEAKQRVKEDESNPMDFVELLTGYSLPLQWASSAMKGTKGEEGMLPFSRLVQAATAWTKPGGVNIEKNIRALIGFPEKDKWNGVYYPIRELGNMVIDEGIPLDAARRAMVEQSGPVWERAVDRAGKYQALKYWTAPVWGDFFPEGEEKQRALQREFSKAMTSDDPEAVNKFFDKYPEYEARMSTFDWEDPEAMLRQYYISQVWDRYIEANDTAKSKISDRLGENFQMLFLNKNTRNYDQIPTETLVRWAAGLGTQPLEVEGGKAVEAGGEMVLSPQEQEMFEKYEQSKEAIFGGATDMIDTLNYIASQLPADQQDEFMQRFPQVQKMREWRTAYLANNVGMVDQVGPSKIRGADPGIQRIYMQYNAERLKRFTSDIFDVQEKFFEQETAEERKEYLTKHPELRAYWDWRGEVLEKFPTLAPYIDSTERIGDRMGLPKTPVIDVTKFRPAVLRQLMGYYTTGEPIGSSALSILNDEYSQGQFEESFREWIDTMLKDSFQYYLTTQ